MGFLKNKHLLLALIVAPVLGVLTYYAIDAMVSEPPQAAEEGESYKLLALPNCRRASEICTMKNGDFELEFGIDRQAGERLVLMLNSKFPLEGIIVAVAANPSEEKLPAEMRRMDDAGFFWSLELTQPEPGRDRMHVVASASQALYFGDAAMAFTGKGTDSD